MSAGPTSGVQGRGARAAAEPAEPADVEAPGAQGAEGPSGEAREPRRPRRDLGAGRRLVVQPVLVLLAYAAFFLWLSQAGVGGTASALLSPGQIWSLTLEHLQLTFLAAAITVVIGVPLGIVLTRSWARRLATPVQAVANFGQAAPAIGLIVLLAIWLGAQFSTAVVSLVAYGLLPVLAGTITGLRGVDQRLVEAGRGMGMSAGAVLRRVELVLAVPVMLSGIRTALVLVVGTATLAAFINGGGLGLLITTGINLADPLLQLSGAVLVALLALLVDWIGRVVEEVARPRGL